MTAFAFSLDSAKAFEIKDNNFTNIEGYIPMEENKEYILFLRENDISEGKQYTIKFISFGKYNTSKEDNIVNQKSSIKYLEEVKDSEFISESQEICDTYFKWKDLNAYVKSLVLRRNKI